MNTIVMMRPRNDVGGGAGSRGGKIIGRTKTGKPIYENHGHRGHLGFTAKEHGEAASEHRKLASGKLRAAQHGAGIESEGGKRIMKEVEHHHAQARKHNASSGKK